jgi:hypothetical protein
LVTVVTAGLYRHYKGRDYRPHDYRVLLVAEWVWDGRTPTTDCELLVIARPAPAVQLRAGGGLYGRPLFTARWSSNTNDVFEGQAIVIYVALYGEGRVAARRLKEFEEEVDVGAPELGLRGARFERIGE